MVLPADHQPTEMVEPGKKSFDPANVCGSDAEDDHLESVSGALHDAVRSSRSHSARQISIQAVAVIRFVADQSCREDVEEAVSEDAFDELASVRRNAFDTNGERKTVIIGESEDFRSLATFGGPDPKPPFLPREGLR